MSTLDNLVTLRRRLTATLAQADAFLNAIPTHWSAADVDLENDGDIAFEWMVDKGKRLSVSVSADGRFPYAWLCETNRAHGVASFDGKTMPQSVLDGMNQLLS